MPQPILYFYWFNGRRLLNGPLDAMLADPGEGFPFCLMWAAIYVCALLQAVAFALESPV